MEMFLRSFASAVALLCITASSHATQLPPGNSPLIGKVLSNKGIDPDLAAAMEICQRYEQPVASSADDHIEADPLLMEVAPFRFSGDADTVEKCTAIRAHIRTSLGHANDDMVSRASREKALIDAAASKLAK